MAPSVTTYVRTFANPLLALAFKDGIDYVGDPDFRALPPKKEGDMWEVLIEHQVDEDDDDAEVININSRSAPKKQLSLGDYQAKLDKMKPRDISSNREIIHPPVKAEPIIMYELAATDGIEPCNACLNCSSGGPCMNLINAACIATAPRKQ